MSVYKIFTNKDNEINNISCYIKNILIENDIDFERAYPMLQNTEEVQF